MPFDKAIGTIQRGAAGMHALLDNNSKHMEGYAKQHASWVDRTATARRAIHGGVDVRIPNESFAVYLAHGVEYGRHLEEGTPPHVITPKNKRSLKWRGADGNPIFAKRVNHPGTKAQPIIEPTVDTHIPVLRKNIQEYWRNI